MWVTEFGMVKFAKEVQLAKAPSPMWVTEFGMVKLTKEPQNAKAQFPMCVTESGMVTVASCLHSVNAQAETVVLSLGISAITCSSESISLQLAISPLLEHLRMFGLKTTLTTVFAAIPASASVSSFPSNLSPTIISTTVVLRVTSSGNCSALICCFSSRPVISGVTSK